MDHDISKICVKTDQVKCNQICEKFCFHGMETKDLMIHVCEVCFIEFTNNNFEKIMNAINGKNHNAELWVGFYYLYHDNYDDSKKYLYGALNNGSERASQTLGYLYYRLKKYDLMKKFYMMSINYYENIISAYNLGIHYESQENYDEMIKYYLHAIYPSCFNNHENTDILECTNCSINNGYQAAMENLCFYHRKISHDYNKMKQYCTYLAKQNNINALSILGAYYATIEVNYDLMKKYLFMAIYNLGYDEVDDECIKRIESDFNINIETVTDIIVDIVHNLGCYYQHVEKNYDKMIKCYMFGVNSNDMNCANSIGTYYQNIKNYEMAEKYFKIAANQKMPEAIRNLGSLYMDHSINYDEMKKYYFMIIYDLQYDDVTPDRIKNIESHNNSIDTPKCNDPYVARQLGRYYQYKEHNYYLMKRYYMMSIEKKDVKSMCHLAFYYYNFEPIDRESILKYSIMSIDAGSVLCFCIVLDIINCVNLYFSVENKKFVSDQMRSSALTNFLNKCSINICSMCYRQMECIQENNAFICGLCYVE